MYFPSALSLLCLASFSGTITADDPKLKSPTFCGKSDCPKYEVVKIYNTFEERNYESSSWVSTQVDMDSYNKAIVEGFWRLFHYIDGRNAAGVKIPMTVPVTSKIIRQESGVAQNITISFFVPFALENPPTPLDPTVYFASLPAQTVYVKSFGGFAFGSDFSAKAKSLSQELNAEGKAFDETFYMTAGYDAPFKLFKRHNEVWFIAA